ncbi:hypothetical protein JCM6882_004692 [Rhodosporidiobolus microsporus]
MRFLLPLLALASSAALARAGSSPSSSEPECKSHVAFPGPAYTPYVYVKPGETTTSKRPEATSTSSEAAPSVGTTSGVVTTTSKPTQAPPPTTTSKSAILTSSTTSSSSASPAPTSTPSEYCTPSFGATQYRIQLSSSKPALEWTAGMTAAGAEYEDEFKNVTLSDEGKWNVWEVKANEEGKFGIAYKGFEDMCLNMFEDQIQQTQCDAQGYYLNIFCTTCTASGGGKSCHVAATDVQECATSFGAGEAILLRECDLESGGQRFDFVPVEGGAAGSTTESATEAVSTSKTTTVKTTESPTTVAATTETTATSVSSITTTQAPSSTTQSASATTSSTTLAAPSPTGSCIPAWSGSRQYNIQLASDPSYDWSAVFTGAAVEYEDQFDNVTLSNANKYNNWSVNGEEQGKFAFAYHGFEDQCVNLFPNGSGQTECDFGFYISVLCASCTGREGASCQIVADEQCATAGKPGEAIVLKECEDGNDGQLFDFAGI